MRDMIIVSEEVRQTITDICRDYPNAVLEYDEKSYHAPVCRLVEDGKHLGMYIRQELVETIHHLFDGKETGTVKLLKEMAVYLKTR